nr:membrane protein [Cystobacter sp.]
MTTVTLTGPTPARPGWLVDRRHDLISTLGGAAASFALVGLHAWGGVSSIVLWWAWVLALDGPHLFATVSRTYLDAREWRTRRRLLLGSLGWFTLGPLLFGVSAALGSRLPFELFLTFASLWAYWHVVRQHYGIMVLYQRKGGESLPLDRRLDSVTLYGGLLAPFVAFAVTHPVARKRLGLTGDPTWEPVVAGACFTLVLALVALYAARQVQRRREGLGVNGPKLLMMGAALGLTAVVFWPSVAVRMDFIMFAVAVTAFHNVQYHGVVWFYHRNRYHAAGVDPAPFGLAPKVSQRFIFYALCGLAFTLMYRGLGCSFGAHPGCGGFGWHTPLAAGLTPRHLMEGFIWGFALHHYYLDQKIWRVSRDAGLNKDLKLGALTPESAPE